MQRQSPPKKSRLGEASDINPTTDPFLRCANMILPWLNPQELSAISQTCKTLALISKSLTFHRSLDATRSLENLPIPFHNVIDSQRYAYFVYTRFQIPASSPPSRQWWGAATECGSEMRPKLDSVSERERFGMSLVDESGEKMYGCECERCEEGYCKCLALGEMKEIANECGSGCGCGSDCPNRVTQKGISVGLKIVRDEKKGWCLYADQLIKQGQFICEYAGYISLITPSNMSRTLF